MASVISALLVVSKRAGVSPEVFQAMFSGLLSARLELGLFGFSLPGTCYEIFEGGFLCVRESFVR